MRQSDEENTRLPPGYTLDLIGDPCVIVLKRVMNLGENRIEMRIPRSAWFLRDLRFPHS
jgi:hypothetical protein